MKDNKILTQFKEAVLEAANGLGVDPREVKRDELKALGLYKNRRTIEAMGGYAVIRDMVFPPETNAETLEVLTASRLIKSQRNKLTSAYGKAILNQEEVANNVADLVSKAGFKLHKPIKIKQSKSKKKRTIVAHISDTHLGANIKANEMGGTNEFNWTVASRRFALFAKQIADYKAHYRKDTDLVLMFNGDIIAGVIHNQEWFADLLAIQQVGAIKVLSQFVSYLASQFSSVRVVCTGGNHDRAMHKSSKDRAMTQKWDSYMTPVYVALRGMLKSYTNVSFDIPKTPYAIVDIQGHNFFQTHGDTVISVGNPGKSLNMESINKQINKLNASPLGGDKHFAAVVCGHVHHNCVHLTESGAFLVINGTLSGGDPFAQGVGFFNTPASQQLFEVTEDFAVGDMRVIRLENADSDSNLDSIIEPYNGEDL